MNAYNLTVSFYVYIVTTEQQRDLCIHVFSRTPLVEGVFQSPLCQPASVRLGKSFLWQTAASCLLGGNDRLQVTQTPFSPLFVMEQTSVHGSRPVIARAGTSVNANFQPGTPDGRGKKLLAVVTSSDAVPGNNYLFQSLQNIAICLNDVRDYDYPQRSVTPETICLSPAAKSLFGNNLGNNGLHCT